MRAEGDAFRDHCGVVGVWNCAEAANLAYLSLYALQHRGQESAGIVSVNGGELRRETGPGMVADVFDRERLDKLPGSAAIGHVRYSTAGDSGAQNAQPFRIIHRRGPLAIAHNGNLVNAAELRGALEQEGSIFRTRTDTEVVLHLVARSRKKLVSDAIAEALAQLRGAFSLVLLAPDALFAARDPHGFRPLSLGRREEGWVVASETCAFDLIEAEFVRDVEPGEMVMISGRKVDSFRPFPPGEGHPCIFEYVYFSRPDSVIWGRPVGGVRKGMGRMLAREKPAEADLVVPVPDSGVPAAMGFAEESGLPFEFGLVRNHYVGRTFIEPEQSIRHFGVKVKLNPARELLVGKRVVLVDDSIVRGTTSRKIVEMVRAAGAREVHMRISCPPTASPCFYGIDTPKKEELIASNHSVGEITAYIGADSLGYLSLEGMHEAVGAPVGSFCNACYTGRYPVTPTDAQRAQLGLFEKTKR
jgi:amidophosphoribosyltransferase